MDVNIDEDSRSPRPCGGARQDIPNRRARLVSVVRAWTSSMDSAPAKSSPAVADSPSRRYLLA